MVNFRIYSSIFPCRLATHIIHPKYLDTGHIVSMILLGHSRTREVQIGLLDGYTGHIALAL